MILRRAGKVAAFAGAGVLVTFAGVAVAELWALRRLARLLEEAESRAVLALLRTAAGVSRARARDRADADADAD